MAPPKKPTPAIDPNAKRKTWLDELGELPGDFVDMAGAVGTGVRDAVMGKVVQPDQTQLQPITREQADAQPYSEEMDATGYPGIEIDANGNRIPDYQNMDPLALDSLAAEPAAIQQLNSKFLGVDPKVEAERMKQAAAYRRANTKSYPQPTQSGQVAGR